MRDVTIDARDEGYFLVDPHIHPKEDGATVFMVTLESDTVVTLTPKEQSRTQKFPRRKQLMDVLRKSFTPQDLDVLHKRGDLLCLSDDARYEFDWAIRQGVDASRESLLAARKQLLVSKGRIEKEQGGPEAAQETEKDGKDASANVAIVANFYAMEEWNADAHEYLICDWWGNPGQLVPRCPRRLAIYISFARAA